MNINAYNTYVGKPYQHINNITALMKTLVLMNNFEPLGGRVFGINHENGESIPFFNFPLTNFGNDRKPFTVLDLRPFSNKNEIIVNPQEHLAFLLCARVQQEIIEGNYRTLYATRPIVAKAFIKAFGHRISSRANLDPSENMLLNVALVTYYTCLTEGSPNEGYEMISANLFKTIFGFTDGSVSEIIEQIGWIDKIDDLYKFLVSQPKMFKLKNTSLIDFISLAHGLWFSSTGKQAVGVAIEFPPLLIGIVATCIKNKSAYGKTGIGLSLDPRHNENEIKQFKSIINNTFDDITL